ncbi:MAG TPA: LysR family transcriptional regulator [Burkholderiales bacterium]|jgi:DNA-binding transcriptional LysR family regulator|nr:LysR family transcriptional regulator [Burkholderiales bacterium]
MSQNLDLSLIRSFVAVAEHGSMTAAAGRLHLTQGAISQHIRRLEEQFGASLFERGPRLRLSQAGERLLGKARHLLAVNDELLHEMRPAPGGGQLRLGLPQDLVGRVFMPILKAFAEARPDVEVLMTCATSPTLYDSFAAGKLDLAVLEEPHAQARGEMLRKEELLWIGAPGGTAHLKRPLPLSMVDRTCAFRPMVIEALRVCGVEWRTMYENGNFETNVATVSADLAVSAALTSLVPEGLRVLDGEAALPPLPPFQISLYAPAQGASAAAGEMARCIRAGFAGAAA